MASVSPTAALLPGHPNFPHLEECHGEAADSSHFHSEMNDNACNYTRNLEKLRSGSPDFGVFFFFF